MITIGNILMVGAGSCLGGAMRYLISVGIQEKAADDFPWGTMIVNIAGCFLLGLIYGFLDKGFQLTTGMKLFLTVGFCGGFTTFSTFINENFLLLSFGQTMLMLLYTAISLAAGLLLLYGGYNVARLF